MDMLVSYSSPHWATGAARTERKSPHTTLSVDRRNAEQIIWCVLRLPTRPSISNSSEATRERLCYAVFPPALPKPVSRAQPATTTLTGAYPPPLARITMFSLEVYCRRTLNTIPPESVSSPCHAVRTPKPACSVDRSQTPRASAYPLLRGAIPFLIRSGKHADSCIVEAIS
ncbi:MAG: hypothetical protein ACI835_004292 [Planctomycetota bacterium]|jgi:hypothetical protein